MAEVITILTAFGENLAADADLKAWAQSTYGRDHTVFEHCDSREMPPPEACPLIILMALKKSGGLGRKSKPHGLLISCVVHDESKETSTAGVVRFLGFRRAEEMRKTVSAKIVTMLKDGTLPGALKLTDLDTEYDPIEQFPYFSADMALVLTETWVSGTSPYE